VSAALPQRWPLWRLVEIEFVALSESHYAKRFIEEIICHDEYNPNPGEHNGRDENIREASY